MSKHRTGVSVSRGDKIRADYAKGNRDAETLGRRIKALNRQIAGMDPGSERTKLIRQRDRLRTRRRLAERQHVGAFQEAATMVYDQHI